jgi:hypothetical protein
MVRMVVLGALVSACGGGLAVKFRVDQFAEVLSLDELMGATVGSMGLLGEGGALPDKWPDTLPPLKFSTALTTPAIPVDLTPPPEDPSAATFDAVNKVVTRIELNKLIVRIEETDLQVPLPALDFQVADRKDADANDRLAWVTIGTLAASADTAQAQDITFTWKPGGEVFLNTQLSDDEKECALRMKGTIGIDTAKDSDLPRGSAKLRPIVEATFFIDPEGVAEVAQEQQAAAEEQPAE